MTGNEFPPSHPPVFNATAESILADTYRLIARAKAVQHSVAAAVKPETATFENVFLPLMQEENQRLYEQQLIEFYASVSTEERIREASRHAEGLFSAFVTETAQRQDLFDLTKAVQHKLHFLDPESCRYVENFHISFLRNGLALSEEDKEHLRQLKQSLVQIEREFLTNCDKPTELWLRKDALEGVDKDFLNTLEEGVDANQGKVRLFMEGLRYHDILNDAQCADTRRQVYFAYANTCKYNVTLLQKALVLRKQRAHLLGYSDHGEFRMANRIEKSPQKIQAFLNDLLERVAPSRDSFVARWREMKHQDLVARGEPDDGNFYAWDRFFYSKKLLSQQYSFDASVIREYFELNETINRMLGIFEKVLGMAFVELEQQGRSDLAAHFGLDENSLTWHEDVRMFAVWDEDHKKDQTRKFLGYLYMDMHHRPGKVSGFSDRPVQPAFADIDGSRKYTSTGLICNFEKPTTTKPCLLDHSMVVLLFHELGHGIHDLAGKTKCARFHGASTPGDFNESPSQMLEQWCWYPTTLRMLSCHYSKLSPEYMQICQNETGFTADLDALPEDLIENLVRSKNAKKVLNCLGFLSPSLFDMAISSAESLETLDTTALFHSITAKTFGLDIAQQDDLPPFQATQEALFTVDSMYTYLAAQIYALDMFHSAFKADPMNRSEGLRYRHTVLEKGSSEDEMAFLTEFLGRAPRADALYEDLGLDLDRSTDK